MTTEKKDKKQPSFPWKTLGTNLAGVGAAHAIGYMSAGLIANQLMKGRLGKYLASMSPAQRTRVIGHAVGAAGSIGVTAASMATLAGQLRLNEEIERRKTAQEKVAHLYYLAQVTHDR